MSKATDDIMTIFEDWFGEDVNDRHTLRYLIDPILTVVESLETPLEEQGWIKWEWTEDKRYPEKLDTKINVRFTDHTTTTNPETVGYWFGDPDREVNESNFHPSAGLNKITHYKVVE